MIRKTEIIMIHQTVLQSWLKDTYSFATLVGTMLAGIYFDSSAMQWIGGIIAFIWMLSRAANHNFKMDIAAARARLDEIEAGK